MEISDGATPSRDSTQQTRDGAENGFAPIFPYMLDEETCFMKKIITIAHDMVEAADEYLEQEYDADVHDSSDNCLLLAFLEVRTKDGSEPPQWTNKWCYDCLAT